MTEQRFHFTPISRDTIDRLWARYNAALLRGDQNEIDSQQDVLEQCLADRVRQHCRVGQWDGNAPKSGG